MNIVNTKTLDTTNWQHAHGTYGGVVTDLEDVEQCIATICGCEKGTVIYNPNLGLPLKNYMDKPVISVIPELRQVIKMELEYQEPRITVDSVAFRAESGGHAAAHAEPDVTPAERPYSKTADENGFLIIKIAYIFEKVLRTKEVETQWQTI